MKFLVLVASLLFVSVNSHHQVDADFAGKAEVSNLSPTTLVNLGQLQKVAKNSIYETSGHHHHHHRLGYHHGFIPRYVLGSHSNIDANLAGDFEVNKLSPETNINLGQAQIAKVNLVKEGLGYHRSQFYRGGLGKNIDVAGAVEFNQLSPQTKINLGQEQIFKKNLVHHPYRSKSYIPSRINYYTYGTDIQSLPYTYVTPKYVNPAFLACRHRLIKLNILPRLVKKRCLLEAPSFSYKTKLPTHLNVVEVGSLANFHQAQAQASNL